MLDQGFPRVSLARRVLLTLGLVLALLLALPALAFARDYSIPRVDIDATVATDGSLTVKEVREFDFDGSYHGVYWKIPTGSYEGRTIDTSILSVGEIVNGEFVEFPKDSSGGEHTYELSEYSNYVQVKLYSSHSDEHAQFAIVYKDANLAGRYDDISLLYWKFVSNGWDVESQNVTCTVHLPVPDGTTVTPEENVRAWGHGPLDAEVGFNGNDVVFKVPGVGTSEFAEARITFPNTWLSDATSLGGNKLASVLEEEQKWADDANAARSRARILMIIVYVAGFGVPLASIIIALIMRSRYKQSHKALFDDKYFRDVPSDDHPAVLGALLNDCQPTDEGLTASLMRLTDQGAMKLEKVTLRKKGFLGREKEREDYCVTQLKYYDRLNQEENAYTIDRETLRFLFQRLAPKSSTATEEGVLYFSDLEDIARRRPESYDNAYSDWRTAVSDACEKRGFTSDDRKTGRGVLIGLCAVDVVVSVGLFMLAFFMDFPVLLVVLLLLVGIAAAIIVGLIAASLDPRSQEAIELEAKTKALRNWLKDFTNLKEAVPQDVVLWNRLLVMAVVLGVADEVIKQLKMVAPQILDDPYMMPVYGWYYYGGSSMPTNAFTQAASEAHSVSAAKLSSSSSSSGGGGGGGFSGGGGGGFGGGGGGGAF